MDPATRRKVRERAGDRCEYCRLRQEHAPLWRHQVEHIIPRKHGGSDDLANLAWACVRCNLGKASNLSGRDGDTGRIVQLFDPRQQAWWDHFAYEDAEMGGPRRAGPRRPCLT